MVQLAQDYAKQLNIEILPLDGQEGGQPSSTKQSADLEAAVAQGVKGIVISPNDANALAPAIQAAIDAGVPVVTVDRNVPARPRSRTWVRTTSRVAACKGAT